MGRIEVWCPPGQIVVGTPSPAISKINRSRWSGRLAQVVETTLQAQALNSNLSPTKKYICIYCWRKHFKSSFQRTDTDKYSKKMIIISFWFLLNPRCPGTFLLIDLFKFTFLLPITFWIVFQKACDTNFFWACFFFSDTGAWTQGFTLAKQALYLLNHSHLQSVLLPLFWKWGLESYMPRVTSNSLISASQVAKGHPAISLRHLLWPITPSIDVNVPQVLEQMDICFGMRGS
jgi:hypothetical protein